MARRKRRRQTGQRGRNALKKGASGGQPRHRSGRLRDGPVRPNAGDRRGRFVIYAAVAGTVILLAGWLLAGPFLGRGSEAAAGPVLVVEADMGGFRPKVLHAQAGETITLRVKSLDTRFHLDGGGKHQFAIDELGINIIAPPRGTEEATLTVAEPGVYPFYCSVCCGGKANPSMWGRLIVHG